MTLQRQGEGGRAPFCGGRRGFPSLNLPPSSNRRTQRGGFLFLMKTGTNKAWKRGVRKARPRLAKKTWRLNCSLLLGRRGITCWTVHCPLKSQLPPGNAATWQPELDPPFSPHSAREEEGHTSDVIRMKLELLQCQQRRKDADSPTPPLPGRDRNCAGCE